jgi:deoxyribodipyrimidine photo-lyase
MRRILWFRRDLRVDDAPLLSRQGDVLPIFIFDPNILSHLSSDDRRVSFIYEALIRLKTALRHRGLDLALFWGEPTEVFDWLLSRDAYDDVCASGDYDAYARERDRDISHRFPFTYLHDTYIFRPDEVLKNDKTPYLVFAPFYNRAKALFVQAHMSESLPADQRLIPFDYDGIHRIDGTTRTRLPLRLSSIGFAPQPLTQHQLRTPETKLASFSSRLERYAADRDFMALEATSGLSADLRFGTISIRAVLRWLAAQKKQGIDTEPFFRQLIFREFYAMLLYHFPHLSTSNFRYPFYGVEDHERFNAFCTSRTGVPIVDAGIRQLLQTGEMHNRVRMICASFLTKNLLLPWQWGERFFAAHLMDYDAASNILSWQWSAGTGVDPQPYFRIFNPYTQTARFDPEGVYIKKYLPELADVPAKLLGDEAALKRSEFGSYPVPIVDHQTSSRSALEYFKNSLAR